MMESARDECWMQLSPTDLDSQELNKTLFETTEGHLMPILQFNSQSSLDWAVPPIHQEEDTTDIALLHTYDQSPQTPISPLGPPARGNYPGPYEFEVQVNGGDTNKKKYLYSHILNRIYVDMKMNFPIQFKWDWDAAGRPLLVRATTVFSDVSQSEKRVERCLQHVHPNNNLGMDVERRHVLQSTRPPNTEGVFYCGNHSEPLSWFSVAVQFASRPDPGSSYFTHAYQFMCKSSCNSGINRRGVEIIFTLEDINGEVVGRQCVGVRVCSCPRRDLKKDEETAPAPSGKRRKASAAGASAPSGKRVKTEPDSDDTAIYSLPPIVGVENYIMALKQNKNNMTASALHSSDDTARAVYQKYIQEYDIALQRLNASEDN